MLFEAELVLPTHQLDEAIRQAELAGIRSAIEASRQLRPDENADSIDVAGGLVAFTGIESPLSQAFGVGMLGPLTAAHVAAITAFYNARGTTPRVFVSPTADITLGHALAAAGYSQPNMKTSSFARIWRAGECATSASPLPTTWERGRKLLLKLLSAATTSSRETTSSPC